MARATRVRTVKARRSARVRSGSGTGERGVALITTLLICALMTLLVVHLAFTNTLWVRQTENIAHDVQAAQAAHAAQLWGGYILEKDDPAVDGLADIWAHPLPPVPVTGGTLTGALRDAQGLFNLNNLLEEDGSRDEIAIEQFTRLLRILQLDPAPVSALLDWMDADAEPDGSWGAEDAYYLGLRPSYLAANRRLLRPEELKLVRGFGTEAWRRLQPHVTALPTRTNINLNTASAEVLAAAVSVWGAPQSALGRALRWTRHARMNPAPDLKSFARIALSSDEQSLPPRLSVNSRYFIGDLTVVLDRTRYRSIALYERQNKVEMLWQARVL